MSWAKRDRIGQADQLIDTTVGNIGPEAGATVTLQVYSGTTLKRTYAGLTSSSWSYPLAEDMADGPLQDVRLVLRSVRDGINSGSNTTSRLNATASVSGWAKNLEAFPHDSIWGLTPAC